MGDLLVLHYFDPYGGGRLPQSLFGANVQQAIMDNENARAIAVVKAMCMAEHIPGV